MILQTLRIVRALNPTLRKLFFATLLFRAGTMGFPFLAAYLVATGEFSAAEIGMVVGAFGVGALVADVLAGVMLSLLPARTVILAGLLVTAAMLAVVPLLSSFPLLVAATLVWGFSYEVFNPAVFSETVAHSTEADRKVAFSCNRLAINLGMGLGPAVGGLLFVWSPLSLFVVNSAMTALAALYILLALHRGEQAVAARAKRHRFRLVAQTGRGEARFWTIFTLAMPIHLAYALPPTVLSAYLIHELGMSSAWVSVVFFLNAGAIVLFEVPLNNAMRHMSHFAGLTIGFALAGVGFLLMAFASIPPVLILGTLVWTAGEMIVFPGLMHYVSEVSDESVTSRNMGLYAAGVNLGVILTPQLALTVGQGATASWYAAGGVVLAALLVILLIRNNSYVWLPEGTRPDETGELATSGRSV